MCRDMPNTAANTAMTTDFSSWLRMCQERKARVPHWLRRCWIQLLSCVDRLSLSHIISRLSACVYLTVYHDPLSCSLLAYDCTGTVYSLQHNTIPVLWTLCHIPLYHTVCSLQHTTVPVLCTHSSHCTGTVYHRASF